MLGLTIAYPMRRFRFKFWFNKFACFRTKEVASVKVIWRRKFVEEASWEVEENMKKRYLHLFESRENAYQGTKFSS